MPLSLSLTGPWSLRAFKGLAKLPVMRGDGTGKDDVAITQGHLQRKKVIEMLLEGNR